MKSASLRRLLSGRLFTFLIGDISARELNSFVGSHMQAVETCGDKDALRWFDEVNVALLEFGDGLISIIELHRAMQAILADMETVRIGFPFEANSITTSNTEDCDIQWEVNQ